MTQTTPDADDPTAETPGGSTISDPEVSGPGDNDGAGDTDNTGDELDAPDPS